MEKDITKTCTKCKETKVVVDFYKNFKICKKCVFEYRAKKFRNQRWLLTYYGIVHRCKPGGVYGIRGIKNYLTKEDVEFLWQRDLAEKMEKPSIDRIDPSGDYTLQNSRFIEFSENVRRPCVRSFRRSRKTGLVAEKVLKTNARSLREAGKILGYSPKYLSRIFKERFGIGYGEYFISNIVSSAKEMLSAGMPVGKVSSSFGYKHPESFSRVFKKYTGINPKEV